MLPAFFMAIFLCAQPYISPIQNIVQRHITLTYKIAVIYR